MLSTLGLPSSIAANKDQDRLSLKAHIVSNNTSAHTQTHAGTVTPEVTAKIEAAKVQAVQEERKHAQNERLQSQLAKTEKALEELKAKLPADIKKVQLPRQAIVKTYVSLFVSCLEERGQQIKIGIDELWQHVRHFFKWHISWRLWMDILTLLLIFGGTTLLGVVLSMLTARWIRSVLGSVFRWALSELSHLPRFKAMMSFVFDVLGAALPVLVLFVAQVSTFFLLESVPDLRNAMLAFATGIGLWVLVWRLKDIFFRYVPVWNLSGQPAKQKHAMLLALQCFLGCWILNDWVLAIFSFAGLSVDAGVFVRLSLGLGMTIAAMTFMRLLRRPLWRWIKANQENQFPVLTTVFWLLWNNLPVLLYALFVLDESVFQQFFSPLLLTTILIPMIPLFFVGLKHMRIQYIWSVRRGGHKGFWYRLLRPKMQAFRVFYVLLYSLVGGVIIQLWDVRFFAYIKDIVGGQTYDQLADIAFLLAIAWAIVHFGDRVLRHYLEKRATGRTISLYAKGRLKTLFVALKTVLRIVVFVTCFLMAMSKLGYNITPFITNLGWLSVVLGWGLQSFIKDYFAGLFILLDNNVVLGDWVDIDGKLGIVEEMSLRTIKVRADSGTLMTISFGSIKVLGNRSRLFSSFLVNLPVSYDMDPEKGKEILNETFARLKRSPTYRKKIIDAIDIRGVNDIVSYAFVLQAKVRTQPTEQEFVRRGFNKILKDVMAAHNFTLPRPPEGLMGVKLPSISSKGYFDR